MIKLNQNLHEITIGLMLGDAGCYPTTISNLSNSRLEFSFGQDNLNYAKYIEFLYKDYINTPVKTYKVKSNKDKANLYKTYWLKTLARPCFNLYRNLFYTWQQDKLKYIKSVPLNLYQLLTAKGLAFFIMGDGNYNQEQNIVRIYTNAFTLDHIRNIADTIYLKFDIVVDVKHDRRGQYILIIRSSQLDKLLTLLKPYMHNSMLYRIGL